MKKFIIGALAIVLTAGVADAQTTENKSRNHGEFRGRGIGPYQRLNLSDAQKTQIKAIQEKEKQEMQALGQAGKATKEQKMTIHNKYKAQYEAVLTPQQREQLAQFKSEKSTKPFGGRGGHGKGLRDDDKFEQLNLTAEQKTRLQQIRADFRTKAEAIRNNNSLTQEQKKSQLQQLMNQQKEQMKAVLTPEQIQKLESFKKDDKGKRKSRVTK